MATLFRGAVVCRAGAVIAPVVSWIPVLPGFVVVPDSPGACMVGHQPVHLRAQLWGQKPTDRCHSVSSL